MKNSFLNFEEALGANERINLFVDDFKNYEFGNISKNFEDDDTQLSIIKELKSFEYELCKNKKV